eukprot:5088862-Pleurochrysis_carterae.AAC.1
MGLCSREDATRRTVGQRERPREADSFDTLCGGNFAMQSPVSEKAKGAGGDARHLSDQRPSGEVPSRLRKHK